MGTRGQRAWLAVAFSGQSAERQIDHSEIRYGKSGKIWVAVLEANDLWHTHQVTKDDAGKVPAEYVEMQERYFKGAFK